MRNHKKSKGRWSNSSGVNETIEITLPGTYAQEVIPARCGQIAKSSIIFRTQKFRYNNCLFKAIRLIPRLVRRQDSLSISTVQYRSVVKMLKSGRSTRPISHVLDVSYRNALISGFSCGGRPS